MRALDSVEGCLQDEKPFCQTDCPFGLDVRDFVAKAGRGAFQAAYRAYANAVGFPGLVARVCDEPCKRSCPRGEAGGAVELRLLEAAAVDLARNRAPEAYNMPPKGKRVAVIGGGPGGLGCALRLAGRKYAVTVFERTGALGGSLRGRMDAGALDEELALQFSREDCDFRLGAAVTDLEELLGGDEPFDAVYVATGAGGDAFGLDPDPRGAFASSRDGVFLGGGLLGSSPMRALADGLRAATAVERWLKIGAMNQPAEPRGTRLSPEAFRPGPIPAVVPQGQVYTPEEAVAEAARCLRCACDACIRSCDMMEYFRKMPRRIAEEVEVTLTPGTLDGNGTVATRLISTCNQCGACAEACPVGIDVGRLLRESHRIMREKGAMPWAFHAAFLRDMEAADGQESLFRGPPGGGPAGELFFPGCQLGASDPRYVLGAYRLLLRHRPDTALALHCCGAPAEWAGDEPLRARATDRIRAGWESLGRPRLVFGCPYCELEFARHLPDLPGESLAVVLAEREIAPPAPVGETRYAVFDPCASRDDPGTRETARILARRGGLDLEELPDENGKPRCCSYGGHVAIAHPPYARKVASLRARSGEAPFLAYCANCRDSLAGAGKPAIHLLDLCLGHEGAAFRPAPTPSERRRNRAALRREALAEFWGETAPPEAQGKPLRVPPEVARKLAADFILEEEALEVIGFCESTGRKLLDPETGAFRGHAKVGAMTCWVAYRVLESGGYGLLDAYGHRMAIEGE